MSNLDVAQRAIEAMESGDVNAFARCLSDDSVCVGLAPHVMDKREYIKVMQALVGGMPDWTFNARDWREEGDRVSCRVEVRATQTNMLPPVLPSAPPVLATGRHVNLPAQPIEFFFDGDEIVRVVVGRGEGSGVIGVLKQLGIDLPYAA